MSDAPAKLKLPTQDLSPAGWSIKRRLLVAVNALVFGVCVLLGLMVAKMSDREVEKRLLQDTAVNAVRLSRRLNLELSNRLARDLAEILDAEIVVWDLGAKRMLGSSLNSEGTHGHLEKGTPKASGIGSLVIDGQAYTAGFAPMGNNRILAVMMEPHKLAIAQRHIRRGLPWLVLLVAGCASVVAILLARSIYRPVARISSWVNSIAGKPSTDDQADRRSPRPVTGPPEISRLAADVESLLTRLKDLQETATREEKLAAVGRFSMAIAHELRNPLSGIKMNAQLAARTMKRQTGSVDRSLELVMAETDRMQFILNELLGLIDGRRDDSHPLPPETCQVDDTIRKVLEFMEPRFAGAEVTVSWKNGGLQSLPCSQVELEQVLYNLLGNAVDAVPEGGDIRLHGTQEKNGTACLTVSDSGNGQGLSENNDIFAPFVTSKQRGAGLGLYVCRKIVERREGSIGWRRDNNRTVFVCTFPGQGLSQTQV